MNCAVCNNTVNSIFMDERIRHPKYLKCSKCGFVFASPQKMMNYTSCYRPEMIYPSSELEISIRIRNYALRYNLFKDYLSMPDAKLLDIGAFNGIFLSYMKSLGFNCLGIELNEFAAAYGRDHFDVNVICTSFEDYKSNSKYDIITMFNVLEHVRDVQSCVVKVRDLLQPKGLFVFEIPNIFSWIALALKGRWHHYENGHNWFFNEDTVNKFMQNHGFAIIKFDFVPKIVTLSKIFDACMRTIGIYRTYKIVRKIQLSEFYCFLAKKDIIINMNDHMLVVARKI